MKASADHRIVGMQILSIIVQDINAATIPKYSAKFRKAGVFMLILLDLRQIMHDIDINLHKSCWTSRYTVA